MRSGKNRPRHCQFCRRQTALTFHHLIPRKVHRRTWFRKHLDRETLNQGVWICRLCHAGIHKRFDEMTLARTFNSAEALLEDEDLRRHFEWVAKQKC